MALRIAFAGPQQLRFYPSQCCYSENPRPWTRGSIWDDSDDFVRLLLALNNSCNQKTSENKRQGDSTLNKVKVEHDKSEEEKSELEKYEKSINVQDFKPDEIKVRVEGDNLIVEAKREIKKEEDGFFSRSYSELRRTIHIPEGIDRKNITSALTGDGILEIEAPLIPTLPPAVGSVEENTKEKVEVEVEQSDEETSNVK